MILWRSNREKILDSLKANKVRTVVVNQLPSGGIRTLAQSELDVNQTVLTRYARRHGDSSK